MIFNLLKRYALAVVIALAVSAHVVSANDKLPIEKVEDSIKKTLDECSSSDIFTEFHKCAEALRHQLYKFLDLNHTVKPSEQLKAMEQTLKHLLVVVEKLKHRMDTHTDAQHKEKLKKAHTIMDKILRDLMVTRVILLEFIQKPSVSLNDCLGLGEKLGEMKHRLPKEIRKLDALKLKTIIEEQHKREHKN